LSSQFRVFTTKVDEVQIPRDIYEVLQTPHWKNVVMEEMNALEKSGTLEVVRLPQDKKGVGSKWVFTVKY